MNNNNTYKLFVQPTPICVDLVRQIKNNIDAINSTNVYIKIDKVTSENTDDKMQAEFTKQGIVRLPALIAPDGRVTIGGKQIIDIFKTRMDINKNRERVSPLGGYEEGSPSNDLQNYWHQQLYAGQDRRGRAIPRDDVDEDEFGGEKVDYQSRMNRERRRQPKHRRTVAQREPDPEYEDNIESDDEDDFSPPPVQRGRRQQNKPLSRGTGDDEMDERMLAAWLDNNPS